MGGVAFPTYGQRVRRERFLLQIRRYSFLRLTLKLSQTERTEHTFREFAVSKQQLLVPATITSSYVFGVFGLMIELAHPTHSGSSKALTPVFPCRLTCIFGLSLPSDLFACECLVDLEFQRVGCDHINSGKLTQDLPVRIHTALRMFP